MKQYYIQDNRPAIISIIREDTETYVFIKKFMMKYNK